MKLVCISDTHEFEDQIQLPVGDVLIHAGDIIYRGEETVALIKFLTWMKAQPFQHKILIAGNHDFCFETSRAGHARQLCKDAGVIYLQDDGVQIDGINFWGSPWQPWFYDWAFNAYRGKDIAYHWSKIPDDTNVLITHGPVKGILDGAPSGFNKIEHVGCEDLADRIGNLPNIKAHICGHIHNGYGHVEIAGVHFVNASICTEEYQPINAPIVIEV